MTKSATIRARIEPAIKDKAEELLHELGITPSQAITMLYRYITRQHEWPLELKVPNVETKRVFSDTDNSSNLTVCVNSEDMFTKLGI